MNTALVLLPPQDRADLVPPPIQFLPNFLLPFPNSTSLSYPRYPAANSEMLAEQVGLHTRGGREHVAAKPGRRIWRGATSRPRLERQARRTQQGATGIDATGTAARSISSALRRRQRRREMCTSGWVIG